MGYATWVSVVVLTLHPLLNKISMVAFPDPVARYIRIDIHEVSMLGMVVRVVDVDVFKFSLGEFGVVSIVDDGSNLGYRVIVHAVDALWFGGYSLYFL